MFLLTVVQIMSVVERGSWDEFLSLEGGGNVHMRLQFVLSEEERNRIRSMVLFPYTLVLSLLDFVLYDRRSFVYMFRSWSCLGKRNDRRKRIQSIITLLYFPLPL